MTDDDATLRIVRETIIGGVHLFAVGGSACLLLIYWSLT